MEKTKRLSVDLEPAKWRRLRLRAINTGRPAAAIAREAIDRYLDTPSHAEARKVPQQANQ